MSLTARDIMETSVSSVSEDAPLIDVHRLFVEEEIHGAPVVSDDGRVLGVVTSADLLRATFEEHESSGATTDYLRDLVEFSGPDWGSRMPEDFQDRLGELRASDCMSTSVVSVPPDASVSEVARLMRTHRVHRVLVTGDDQLIGLISTFDLVGVLEKQGS